MKITVSDKELALLARVLWADVLNHCGGGGSCCQSRVELAKRLEKIINE